MHVAATAPLSLNTDDLDPAAIEKERAVLIEKAKEEGRPEAMIDKIVEGQINKFQKDVVLTKQPFVMDPDVTIEQLVANSAKELARPTCTWRALSAWLWARAWRRSKDPISRRKSPP